MDSERQKTICAKYGSDFMPPASFSKLGVAENVGSGLMPINGLRHVAENGTNGWYIWAGKTFSEASDFFQPLHIEHITERSEKVADYLALAPGWRFLITHDYEDVWFDENLIL